MKINCSLFTSAFSAVLYLARGNLMTQKKRTSKAKASKAVPKKKARAIKSKYDRMLEELTADEITLLAWQKSYENRLKGKRLD